MKLRALYRILVSIALVLATSVAHSQFLDAIDWSESYSIERQDRVLDIFAINDTLAGALIESDESISVLLFGKKIRRQDLEIENCCSSYQHYVRDNQLVIFTRLDDEIGNRHQMLQFELGIDTITPKAHVKVDLGLKAGTQNKPIFAYTSLSAEYSLVCQQSAFRKTENAKIKLRLIANGEQTEAELPTEYSGDDFEILGASIDNRGQVFIAAKTGIKLNSPFRRKYLILSYDHKQEKLTEFDLSSDQFFMQDLLIQTNEKGIEISSLYTIEPLEETYSDGYFWMKVDTIGENIIDRTIRTFTPDMVEINRSIDDKKPGIEHVFLDRIFDLDGEPMVTFEKRFQDQVCTTDPRTGIVSCTDMYYFKGVSVETPRDRRLSFTIERSQVDVERISTFSSHAWLETANGLILFYNDHFKNESVKSERMMNNASRSVIRYVGIGKEGFQSSGVLTEDRQSGHVFLPKLGVESTAQSAFFLAREGRSYRMARINLGKLLPALKGY